MEQVHCELSQLRGVNRREAYFFSVGSKCWLIVTCWIYGICIMCLLVLLCVYIYRDHCFGYTTPITTKKKTRQGLPHKCFLNRDFAAIDAMKTYFYLVSCTKSEKKGENMKL